VNVELLKQVGLLVIDFNSKSNNLKEPFYFMEIYTFDSIFIKSLESNNLFEYNFQDREAYWIARSEEAVK